MVMGVPLWIFIHDTDKVVGVLKVLFLGHVFFRCPPSKFFANALGHGMKISGYRNEASICLDHVFF